MSKLEEEKGLKIREKIDSEVFNLNSLIGDFKHATRFLSLLEQDDCPIYVGYSHPSGKFVYVSRPFADALGYTKKEIYEIPWIDLIKNKEEADKVSYDYIEAIREGKSFANYKTTYVKKDGSDLNLTWYTGIVHPDEDKLTLCIAIETPKED